MSWQPYSPHPILVLPRECQIISGYLHCNECGRPLRPRDDGRGWNCYGCDVLVSDDKELRAKFGGEVSQDPQPDNL